LRRSRQPGQLQRVALTVDGVTTHWYVHTKVFQVPKHVVAKEPSRQGITHRSVSIVLPMGGSSKTSSQSSASQAAAAAGNLHPNNHMAGKVFAFLPTEEDSRLPFAVNADFGVVGRG